MNELVNLNQIVSEIKFFENQAVVSYWEIGKRLSKAKKQVGHGNWYDWVDENLGYSRRVTQQLIKIGDSISNPNTYSHLTFSKALALTTIKDEEERQDFIDSHEVEDMTTRKLQEEIKSYKENLKAKEEELNNTKNELGQAKTALTNKERQIEEETNERIRLSGELEQAKNKEPEVVEKEVIKEVTPDDYEDLKERVKDLREKQKDLENKLFVEKEAKKRAVSQLEEEEQKEKLIKEINSFAWTINSFFKNVGGLLYLTEFLNEVPTSSKNLFIKSANSINGWTTQLMKNIEDNN